MKETLDFDDLETEEDYLCRPPEVNDGGQLNETKRWGNNKYKAPRELKRKRKKIAQASRRAQRR